MIVGPRNLWLLRSPEAENFRWYEVSYFESLQRTKPAPFGVNNKNAYHNADLAASVVVGPWQLALWRAERRRIRVFTLRRACLPSWPAFG